MDKGWNGPITRDSLISELRNPNMQLGPSEIRIAISRLDNALQHFKVLSPESEKDFHTGNLATYIMLAISDALDIVYTYHEDTDTEVVVFAANRLISEDDTNKWDTVHDLGITDGHIKQLKQTFKGAETKCNNLAKDVIKDALIAAAKLCQLSTDPYVPMQDEALLMQEFFTYMHAMQKDWLNDRTLSKGTLWDLLGRPTEASGEDIMQAHKLHLFTSEVASDQPAHQDIVITTQDMLPTEVLAETKHMMGVDPLVVVAAGVRPGATILHSQPHIMAGVDPLSYFGVGAPARAVRHVLVVTQRTHVDHNAHEVFVFVGPWLSHSDEIEGVHQETTLAIHDIIELEDGMRMMTSGTCIREEILHASLPRPFLFDLRVIESTSTLVHATMQEKVRLLKKFNCIRSADPSVAFPGKSHGLLQAEYAISIDLATTTPSIQEESRSGSEQPKGIENEVTPRVSLFVEIPIAHKHMSKSERRSVILYGGVVKLNPSTIPTEISPFPHAYVHISEEGGTRGVKTHPVELAHDIKVCIAALDVKNKHASKPAEVHFNGSPMHPIVGSQVVEY
jgi:hypothetical protein